MYTTLLRDYIETLPEFELRYDGAAGYDHMGALLVDAALQAGINYATVVEPRVNHVRSEYSEEAKTTSGFQRVLMLEGASKLLNWSPNSKKMNTLVDLTQFFVGEQVETVEELRAWLLNVENIGRLRGIKGVGPKTVDYFKILCRMPASAIDRHLYKFLAQAGIDVKGYYAAQNVIRETAELMGVDERILDHSIWSYMARQPKVLDKINR